ncbi:MAG TPA: glutamate synthase-related protein [Candidatus Acidoferrum sp.]|nr:glutamate synthase-related protein [Candidatus Acidoferrum sp.]
MKATYERYHVTVKDAAPKIKLPPKFIIKRYNNCTNVQECVQACVYSVHEAKEDGKIAEPNQDLCRGCYMCALKCPKGAISIGINPEFEKIGNSYYTPDRIKTIYFEAESGRVPVSGAGYTGPFTGEGFDSIWFDFSEIVRPTRDGIHGREYISTSVDLGRRLQSLQFDKDQKLLSSIPRTLEIPIPMILDAPPSCGTNRNLSQALAKAAAGLKTFAIVNALEYSSDLIEYKANLIPRISSEEIDAFEDLVKASKIVEVDLKDHDVEDHLKKVKAFNPSALVSFYFSYDKETPEKADAVAKTGGDIVHFHVEDKIVEKDPNVIKNAIRTLHSYLVEKHSRDKITLISSGGIAEAAHVPKSIILGANAVAVGTAYQIALGCKLCHHNTPCQDCTLLLEDADVDLAAQRITNLIGAWRDQLLEVLGGMGLREVRRQTGEVGRAMFFEDLETKVFGDKE